MTEQISKLANGLTIVTHTMEHLKTTSLGVWVRVGSRHERESEHGISHFLEHMSFKGTSSRSAQSIAEEIEAVGGELNAATGLETTAYFARVLAGDEGVALMLIADILLNSEFAADELERERDVILQEIAATRDVPDDIAFELVNEAAYPRQALGRTILGTDAHVKAFTANDLRHFLARHYKPQNMVIAAAGAVRHEPLLRHAEALFGGLTRGESGLGEAARYEGGVRFDAKPFEQSHLVLAFEGPSYRERDYFAAQVFSGLLGGGMSSRLFQEAREKRGLCYSIYSSAWGLDDTGLFAVHAATGTETMASLIEVTGAELDDVASKGPTPAELLRAKAQLKAGLLMSLESSAARAEQMARQMLMHGRLVSSDELISKVDVVTDEDVCLLARRLRAATPSVAVVGAGRSADKLARLAAARVEARAGRVAWLS